jgi:uncharacterized protein YqgC (DUF456 family)
MSAVVAAILGFFGSAPGFVRRAGQKPDVVLGVLVQAFCCDVIAQSLRRACKFDIAGVVSLGATKGV